MSEIEAILQGLGTAALNPLAFVAYIVAIIAWAYLRHRVQRNKNLLDRINAFPREARAEALRAEMGAVPLKEGLSAEQWIRSRIHLYYFLAFIVLCSVVVILFAISSFQSAYGKAQVPPAEDPNRAIMKAISAMELGDHQDFVVSMLGQPRHVLKGGDITCTDYEFPFADLKIWFDQNNDVILVSVLAKNSSFRPVFFKRLGCLGCLSFRDVGEEPDRIDFDEGIHGPTIYLEQYDYSTGRAAPSYRQIFLIHSSAGSGNAPDDADEGKLSDLKNALPSLPDILDVYPTSFVWSRHRAFSEFLDTLPADPRTKWIKLRAELKPNAYGFLDQGLYEKLVSSDFAQDAIPSDPGCTVVPKLILREPPTS